MLTDNEIQNIYFKKCSVSEKSNKKQFQEFNVDLFKSYINKFSDEDKIKAFEILIQSVTPKGDNMIVRTQQGMSQHTFPLTESKTRLFTTFLNHLGIWNVVE